MMLLTSTILKSLTKRTIGVEDIEVMAHGKSYWGGQ